MTLISLMSLSVYAEPKQEFSNKDEFLKYANDSSGDLSLLAKNLGIDYAVMVKNCLNDKDKASQLKSWKLLLWFVSNESMDGAAGEELSRINRMSQFIDDKRLLEIISNLPKGELKNLPLNITWRFGYEKMSPANKLKFMENQPVAFSLIEQEKLKRDRYQIRISGKK